MSLNNIKARLNYRKGLWWWAIETPEFAQCGRRGLPTAAMAGADLDTVRGAIRLSRMFKKDRDQEKANNVQ